jgi:hypothetical protein
MIEKKPITNLPDLSDLPPDVQEFVRGMAEEGIEVTPGRPDPNRSRPEPLRVNTSPGDALAVGRDEHGMLLGHKPNAAIALQEEEPIAELPDLSDLPPDVQELIRRLAKKGIEVTPGRPDSNRVLPEPLRLNTSLSAAVIEERDEYGR